MILNKLKIFTLVIILNQLLHGQAYFQGITHPINAAGWSMASATSTIYKNGTGVFLNPSLISLSPSSIHTNLTSFVLDINSLNMQILFNKTTYSWGLSLSYLNYGKFLERDMNGIETGSFHANDKNLTLYYGGKIVTNIYFGFSGTYLSSNLSSLSSNAITGSVGMLYHNPNNTLSIGFTYKNSGYNMSNYSNNKEQIPSQYIFGISKHLAYLPVTIAADFQKQENRKPIVNLGLEIDIKEYLVIRVGSSSKRFNLQNEYDVKNFLAGSSCGFGIMVKKYQFDFGFSSLGDAGNISSISITKIL